MRISTLFKWLIITPLGLAGLVLLVILPFIVLIKGATMAYFAGMSTSGSLIAGTAAAFVVLVVYLVAIDKACNRHYQISIKVKLLVATVVVLVFNGYALFILNEQNVKNQKIAKEYTNVHPILRLGVRMWSLFEPSLVITDMTREARDYRRMRLRTYNRSLHFVQIHNQYVHAIDLRTNGRTELRNWTTNVVMIMMGFKTLRHVGTADHLHVELPLRAEDKQQIAILLKSRPQKVVKQSHRKRHKHNKRKRRLASTRKRRTSGRVQKKEVPAVPSRSSTETPVTTGRPSQASHDASKTTGPESAHNAN